MPDELEPLKHGGIGAAAAGLLAILWGAFIRKGEKNEDKVDADRDAKVMHLEKRLEGMSKDHAERIRQLELRVENIDTRLKSREGLQGRQHTGVTQLSKEQLLVLRSIQEETDDGD